MRNYERWTQQEDEILLKHINNNSGNIKRGARSASKELSNRTAHACTTRFHNYLKSKTNQNTNNSNNDMNLSRHNTRWTEKEDQILAKIVSENSPNLEKAHEIAADQLGRTKAACYSRYNVIKSRYAMFTLSDESSEYENTKNIPRTHSQQSQDPIVSSAEVLFNLMEPEQQNNFLLDKLSERFN